MKLLASSIIENPVILVLILVAAFGVIVIGVILIKKYVPAFKNNDKPKSEKEIAQEEVDRLVVDLEEGMTEKGKESKKEAKEAKKAAKIAEKEEKPSEEEALKYEMDNLLEDAPDAVEKKEDEEDK